MQVTIVFLGGSRVQAGADTRALELPTGATVGDVEKQVVDDAPELAEVIGSARWAVNFEFASPDHVLQDGDEVALLPPVAGGADSAWVTDQPLDPQKVAAAVGDPTMGATVLFVGNVRNHARGKNVTALHYEAYEPMATRQLQRIVHRLESEFDGVRVAISHRHGDVPIGESAVIIAAASPHRGPAFDAARAAIEHIKEDVPIWKRERTDDGEEWVGWGGG